MKRLNRIISFLTAIIMVIPMCVLVAFGAEAEGIQATGSSNSVPAYASTIDVDKKLESIRSSKEPDEVLIRETISPV